jgi:hypothetical protein
MRGPELVNHFSQVWKCLIEFATSMGNTRCHPPQGHPMDAIHQPSQLLHLWGMWSQQPNYVFFGAGNAGPCLATTMATAECGQGSSWTPWHRYTDLCLLRLVEGGCKLAASTVSSAELQVHSCQCRPQVQSHKCKATSAAFSLRCGP